MKRLLIAALLAGLTLALSAPAMADHRHHGHRPQVHFHHHDHHADRGRHHFHHHDHRANRGRHHYQKRYRAAMKRHHHRYRSGPRVIERHYHHRPSRHRRHSDIPLVTIGGYPAVRIRINH